MRSAGMFPSCSVQVELSPRRFDQFAGARKAVGQKQLITSPCLGRFGEVRESPASSSFGCPPGIHYL
ncbi:MAG: hypothetical protein JWQ87_3043 [Candidatus Sulfotelmatobacter sp.]|nr:hypothetical protein [Candidatus Sulfotelmatobacter sp.]